MQGPQTSKYLPNLPMDLPTMAYKTNNHKAHANVAVIHGMGGVCVVRHEHDEDNGRFEWGSEVCVFLRLAGENMDLGGLDGGLQQCLQLIGCSCGYWTGSKQGRLGLHECHVFQPHFQILPNSAINSQFCT